MSFKYEASGFALTLAGPVLLNSDVKAVIIDDQGPKAAKSDAAPASTASLSKESSPTVATSSEDIENDVTVLEDVAADEEEPEEDAVGLGDFFEFTEDIRAVPTPAPAVPKLCQSDVHDPEFQPPWVDFFHHIKSPLLRLHNEIVELCKMLEASEEEAAVRQQCVDEVADVVNTIWPGAKTLVFGSFATGLYVPTSDIDLVVMDAPASNVQEALKALANALVRKGVAKNMQVIGKARVPIIKFEGAETGIKFDVSFNVPSGPEGAGLVKEMLETWPPMKPLVLMLKVFLQQRELNEVYSGGLGSYSLITLVASFLQLHASRRPHPGHRSKRQKIAKEGEKQAGPLEEGLGVLLVDLLRTYGRIINTQKVGISCRDGGFYFRKSDRPEWVNPDRPSLMAIEDPADETNDIGRNSFNIMKVRAAFDWAYQLLVAPCSSHESLLARVLHLKPLLAGRGNPTWRQPYPKLPPPKRNSGFKTPTPRPRRDSSDDRNTSGKRARSESRSDQHTPHQPHIPSVSPQQYHPWQGLGTPFGQTGGGAPFRSPPPVHATVPLHWQAPTPFPHGSGGPHSGYGRPSVGHSAVVVNAPYGGQHGYTSSGSGQGSGGMHHSAAGLGDFPRSRSAPPARPGNGGYSQAANGQSTLYGAPYAVGLPSYNGAGQVRHSSQGRLNLEPLPQWAHGTPQQGSRSHSHRATASGGFKGKQHSGNGYNTHIRFD